MDLFSSQQVNEQTQSDRRKALDGSQVIFEQRKAVSSSAKGTTRKFRYEDVEIATISGVNIKTKMWISDEKPKKVVPREAEVFKCEMCGKEFDKRQKVLLHQRFHKK